MTLRTLRHDAIAWLRRPWGRSAAFALLLMLVAGWVPAVEIHAHADLGTGHAHVADHHDDAGSDREIPQSPTDVTVHVHDASAGASGLPELPRPALSSIPAPTHVAPPVLLPTILFRLTAPHRPPIA